MDMAAAKPPKWLTSGRTERQAWMSAVGEDRGRRLVRLRPIPLVLTGTKRRTAVELLKRKPRPLPGQRPLKNLTAADEEVLDALVPTLQRLKVEALSTTSNKTSQRIAVALDLLSLRRNSSALGLIDFDSFYLSKAHHPFGLGGSDASALTPHAGRRRRCRRSRAAPQRSQQP